MFIHREGVEEHILLWTETEVVPDHVHVLGDVVSVQESIPTARLHKTWNGKVTSSGFHDSSKQHASLGWEHDD